MNFNDQCRVVSAIAEAHDHNPPAWVACDRPEREYVRYAKVPKLDLFALTASDTHRPTMAETLTVEWYWHTDCGPSDGWYAMDKLGVTEERRFWIYGDVVCVEVDELPELHQVREWRRRQIQEAFMIAGLREEEHFIDAWRVVNRALEMGMWPRQAAGELHAVMDIQSPLRRERDIWRRG